MSYVQLSINMFGKVVSFSQVQNVVQWKGDTFSINTSPSSMVSNFNLDSKAREQCNLSLKLFVRTQIKYQRDSGYRHTGCNDGPVFQMGFLFGV